MNLRTIVIGAAALLSSAGIASADVRPAATSIHYNSGSFMHPEGGLTVSFSMQRSAAPNVDLTKGKVFVHVPGKNGSDKVIPVGGFVNGGSSVWGGMTINYEPNPQQGSGAQKITDGDIARMQRVGAWFHMQDPQGQTYWLQAPGQNAILGTK